MAVNVLPKLAAKTRLQKPPAPVYLTYLFFFYFGQIQNINLTTAADCCESENIWELGVYNLKEYEK